MAIYPQRLTIYLYSAHCAVIFAIAQLSCMFYVESPTCCCRWYVTICVAGLALAVNNVRFSACVLIAISVCLSVRLSHIVMTSKSLRIYFSRLLRPGVFSRMSTSSDWCRRFLASMTRYVMQNMAELQNVNKRLHDVHDICVIVEDS